MIEPEFLSREEELILKSRFIILKNSNFLNTRILNDLIKLNSLDGFVVVESNISINSISIAVKFTEDLTFPVTESIHRVSEEDLNVGIEWNTHVNISYLGEIETITGVIIIRSVNTQFLKKFISYLID